MALKRQGTFDDIYTPLAKDEPDGHRMNVYTNLLRLVLISEETHGVWTAMRFDDGTEQVRYTGEECNYRRLIIERVVLPKSRRKRWTILSRSIPGNKLDGRMYPPKVAGPFKDLPSAKAALLVLLGSN